MRPDRAIVLLAVTVPMVASLVALVAVGILVLWGADWRWLPTVAGVVLVLVVILGAVENVWQHRRGRQSWWAEGRPRWPA